MGKEVYFKGGELVSALGNSLQANMEGIKSMQSGIKPLDNKSLSNEPLYAAAIDFAALENDFKQFDPQNSFTRFERLLIYTAQKALKNSSIDIGNANTQIILSTTKGNIELLDSRQAKNYPRERIYLWSAAETIARFLGNPNKPMVVSNACVSGVLAINLGASLIRAGKAENVVILGGDILSKFVISGFQSFQSLSPQVCKPFDADRDGLSLGEAAGCMLLSSEKEDSQIKVLGGSTHNDANHISGPSRTAEGFYYAATSAIRASGLENKDIDYISAHGTATPYNDEMEAIGIGRLGLENVPLHSLKAYWGHTLGAAGIIEALCLIESMKQGIALPTPGYEKHGVSIPINVVKELQPHKSRYALKLASGFSGVNSSVVFENMEEER